MVCLWVIFYWAAGPVGVPGFDFFGIPEWRSAVEVRYRGWGAVVGGVVCPSAWCDPDVGGTVGDAPEFAPGVFVGDDGVHYLSLIWAV